MVRFLSLSLLTLTLAFANVAVAKDKVREARSNDVAQRYILKDNGDFFRVVGRNNCQITNDVADFKVSQHPNDVAMVYFVKRGDLYVLNNADRTGQCPKAEKKEIMSNLARVSGEWAYNVVPDTNTAIVNTALDESGRFVAWDNRKAVFSSPSVWHVVDYDLNPNYGRNGKPFSSYVAFLIDKGGFVYKLKGRTTGAIDESNWDRSRSYGSLKEFKRENGIH